MDVAALRPNYVGGQWLSGGIPVICHKSFRAAPSNEKLTPLVMQEKPVTKCGCCVQPDTVEDGWTLLGDAVFDYVSRAGHRGESANGLY